MATASERIIMGIDPGTNLLGYALLSVKGKQTEILAVGVIDLRKCTDVYAKLGRIYEHIQHIIKQFHPQELAIEAPFFGKNAQSMLKLGRAQGVAIAAAIEGGLTVHEYAPTRIKMAITGIGSASKEQVSLMLQKIFKITNQSMGPYMDASDALAAAYCHFLQSNTISTGISYKGWGDFIQKNASRVCNDSKKSL